MVDVLSPYEINTEVEVKSECEDTKVAFIVTEPLAEVKEEALQPGPEETDPSVCFLGNPEKDPLQSAVNEDVNLESVSNNAQGDIDIRIIYDTDAVSSDTDSSSEDSDDHIDDVEDLEESNIATQNTCKTKVITLGINDSKQQHTVEITTETNTLDPQQPHAKNKQNFCKRCNQEFGSSAHKKKHECVNQENMYKCKDCKKTFCQQKEMHLHKCSQARTYFCGICWAQSTGPDGEAQLKAHKCIKKLPHSGKKTFPCKDCGEAFEAPLDLETHAEKHAGVKKQLKSWLMKKNDCQKIGHDQDETSTTIECNAGNKKLELKSRLVTHLSHVCDVCNKAFKQSSSLTSHKLTHCKDKPFTCDVCDKAFVTAYHLSVHEKQHAEGTRYKCELCYKEFNFLSSLKWHQKNHGADTALALESLASSSASKVYPCAVCQKKCSNTSNLKAHLRTHTGKKPFACNMCNLKFTHNNTLKNHKMTHTGEKPYVCFVCQKPFTQIGNMIRHQQIHVKEKVFNCRSCNKPFGSLDLLAKHTCDVSLSNSQPMEEQPENNDKIMNNAPEKIPQEIDNEDSSATCKVCNKTFLSTKILAIHSRIHYVRKPHLCPHCGQQFMTATVLKIHIRSHSSNETPVTQTVQSRAENKNTVVVDKAKKRSSKLVKIYLEEEVSRKTMTEEKDTYEMYICHVCKKRFDRSSSYYNHVRSLHPGAKEKLFACRHCPKRYPRLIDVSRHERIHGTHPKDDKTFDCRTCNIRFGNLWSYHSHKKVHKARLYESSRKMKDTVVKHAAKVTATDNNNIETIELDNDTTEIDLFEIETEEMKTAFESAIIGAEEIDGRLESRIIEIDTEQWTDKSAKISSNHRIHINNTATKQDGGGVLENAENRYVCELCNRSFTSMPNYVTHLQSHRETIEQEMPFVCHRCSYRFCFHRDLAKHESSCHQTLNTAPSLAKRWNHTSYQCKICDQIFNRLPSYHRHLMDEHQSVPQDTNAAFACQYCGKQFRTLAYLCGHEKLHTGRSEFVCRFCQKPFPQQSNLKHHLRAMHRGQTVTNEECRKIFEQQFARISQLKTDPPESDDAFQCDICGEMYEDRSSIMEHIVTHEVQLAVHEAMQA